MMSEDEWKREAVFLRGMLAKSYESYKEVMKDLIKAHAEIIALLEERYDSQD